MINRKLLIEPIQYVVEKSQFVHIDINAIGKFCRNFTFNSPPHWNSLYPLGYHRRKKDEDELDFLFLIGSQAFCFWGFPEKWIIEYKNRKLDGWWALVASFERALEKGIPILDGHYLAQMTIADTRKLFSGEPEIPLLSERKKILNSIGKRLVAEYQGRFYHCYRELKQDAFSILEELITFKGFNDVGNYQGKKIYFFKKAQVVVTDIFEIFEKKGFGDIKNIDQLLGHADYKIPAILRKIGILMYDKKLAQKVDNRRQIKPNSEMEIEIRANTLWAIHLIAEQMKPRFPDITPTILCGILWGMSQKRNRYDKPYHLTETISY